MKRLLLAASIAVPTLAAAQEVATPYVVGEQPFFGAAPSAPSVAVAGDGSFVVAWRQPSGPNNPVIGVRRFDAAGAPLGPPSLLAGAIVAPNLAPAVAADDAGNFTVVWTAPSAVPQGGADVVAQRFDASGVPQGPTFRVNAGAAGNQIAPAITMAPTGESLVVWSADDGSASGIYGRALDAAGTPLGSDFRVNVATAGSQLAPAVALDAQGRATVAWHGRLDDGSADDIFARRVDMAGTPLGGEIQVNTFTADIQAFPVVAALADGGFVVAWTSTDGPEESGSGIFARRYDAAGNAPSPEFRVARTPIVLAPRAATVVQDGPGFAIAWERAAGGADLAMRRYDAAARPVSGPLGAAGPTGVPPRFYQLPALGSDRGGRLVLVWGFGYPSYSGLTYAERRYGAAWPSALHVDEQPSGYSDGNGVLELGEVVTVAPAWYNAGLTTSAVSGSVSSFTGPGGPLNPAYVVIDGQATYGNVAAGTARTCSPVASCYGLGVALPSARPQRHMDATFVEQLAAAPGEATSHEWTLHVGGSFDDVPHTSGFYRFAETLLHVGVSNGCSATSFCPDTATSRRQMAIFLLTSKLGSRYMVPLPPLGLFDDVPPSDPFAPWIEDLANRGVVGGCAPSLYCPDDPVTRGQMAVMLLRTLEGSAYVPPACSTPFFGDVPCSNAFAPWIYALAARGFTAGCGGGNYCPDSAVSRGQMAVFLTRTFDLTLYGPERLRDPGAGIWSRTAGPFEP